VPFSGDEKVDEVNDKVIVNNEEENVMNGSNYFMNQSIPPPPPSRPMFNLLPKRFFMSGEQRRIGETYRRYMMTNPGGLQPNFINGIRKPSTFEKPPYSPTESQENEDSISEESLSQIDSFSQKDFKKRKSKEETDSELDDSHKLPPSKTPIIDALIYCALKEDGITIESRTDSSILFRVSDYDTFYEKQKQVCSKQNPTDDESSRVKTIQRWFKNFPTKKERSKSQCTSFFFSVDKSVSEDKFRKIGKIIDRLECSLNVHKRRRTK